MRPEQLAAHLRKTLAPLYLVFGEETLLAQESADTLRAAARERHAERECLTVDAGFDWNALRQLAASPSLFANRRLLELRLGNAKPATPAPGAERVCGPSRRRRGVVITAGKLDWNTQKKPLVRRPGCDWVVVPAAPVESGQLPAWIERRLRERGLKPTLRQCCC